jgi:hypothetical protein
MNLQKIWSIILKPLTFGFLFITLIGFFGTFWSYTNVKWYKTYNAPRAMFDSYIVNTKDKGFLVGTSYGSGYLKYDIHLTKTDSRGKTLWEKTLGRDEWDEHISAIASTSDGGYIITGESTPQIFQSYVFISKIDSMGNEEWHTDIGHHECEGMDVAQIDGGGYIIVGQRDDAYEPYPDLYIVRIDSNGKLIWDKKFGGESYEWASAVTTTVDKGFIIAGVCDTESESRDAIWVMKFNPIGNIDWERKIDGDNKELASDIEVTLDGGFIISGSTHSWGNGKSDFLAVKMDPSGREEWRRTYGREDWDVCHSVVPTLDGGYVFVGSSGTDIMVVKTDSDGNELWSKYIGGFFTVDEGRWIFEVEGDRYVLGGIRTPIPLLSRIILMEIFSDSGLPTKQLSILITRVIILTLLGTLSYIVYNLKTKWKTFE